MRRRLVILAPLALGVLPYLPVLARGYFQADDFAFVRLFHALSPGEFGRLFYSDPTPAIWGESLRELRPFVSLAYRLDFAVWGLNAFGFHLTNVLLHVLNCWLVLLLARRMLPPVAGASWLATALFAVAPCHAEAVSWINGRTDLVAAGFYLGSCLLFVLFSMGGNAGHYGASLACFAAGLFAKESLFTLPLLLTVYCMLYRPRPRLVMLAPFWILVGGSMLLRRLLFGGVLGPHTTTLPEFLSRQRFYLESLLFPAQEWLLVSRVALVLLMAAGTAFAWRYRRSLFFVGPLWYLVTAVPLIVTYRSTRHLYIASAGISMGLGLMVAALPRARAAVACFWLAVYGVAVADLARQWGDAGAMSRKLLEGIETLSVQIPPGSTVLLPGAGYWPAYVWEWAVPHTLEPPFSGLYSRFRFVEHPELSCCPGWEKARQPALAAAMSAGAFLIRWDAARGEPVVEGVSAERLRGLWETTAGGGFGSSPLTVEQGRRFLGRLRDPP